jgi:hypothetical protein
MHRTSVAPAIREAEALGFIRVTERSSDVQQQLEADVSKNQD